MKIISLTKGKFALIDDCDLELVGRYKWYAHKSDHTFYAFRWDGVIKKIVPMQNAILGITDSTTMGDHIDHNGLNNQRFNIRKCSNSQNRINTIGGRESIGMRGVCFTDNRFRSTIHYNGVCHILGYYKTNIEAALAYNEAAVKIHGEFAMLNTISHDFLRTAISYDR